MRNQPSRRFGAIAIGLVLALTVISFPIQAKEKKKPIERFKAQAMTMGTATGKASFLNITIYRYSTDEERQLLLKTLKGEGAEELYDVLNKQDEMGYLQVPGSMGYEMRYARDFREGDRRTIIMATDRPIGLGEAMRNTRTRDNAFSLVQLNLDESGHGEGTLVVGAELEWDEEKDKLVIEGLSTEPVRLTKVKPKK
jgi:hypothetical protein